MKKQIGNEIVEFEMTAEEIAQALAEQQRAALAERSHPLTESEVLAKLIPTAINSLEVDDNTALRMMGYYPQWASGTEYTDNAGRPVGYRVRRGGKLFKLRQEHTSQIGWEPENAASLWEQVCESHDGSEDDPIPYEGNMALKNGLYYMQDWVVYRCIRDTGNPVYHRLEELVGIYVEQI